MSKLLIYDGEKWASPSSSSVLSWDGTKWITPQVKVFDGQKWSANILEQKVIKTWNATWSESYDNNNNINHYTNRPGEMAQGKYGAYDPTGNIYHNPVYWGRQRSLVGFNVREVQNDLSGARIEKVELYLHSSHAWYVTGASASIGVHGFSVKPNKFGYTKYGVKEVKFNGRDQGQWIELDASIGVDFSSGKAGGFTLFKESDSQQYYGFWNGASAGNKAPKLRITYYTNSATGQAQEPNTPTQPAKYTSVLRGEGLVQVVERLMRSGALGNDFFANRSLLMKLNNFSSSNPILQIGQQIMYQAAK